MARAGRSRRRRGGRIEHFLALTLLFAAPAAAATPSAITLPASSLDSAILLLARQSGADIVTAETGLGAVPTRPLRGRMTTAAALARLLAGTGYRALAIDANSFRIVAALRPVRPPPSPPGADDPDIIVTASKQPIRRLRFPGSIISLAGDAGSHPARATADTDAVARSLSVLQNTDLGAGRNKIFIRGIADSSFNGATQSTASVYFGDVQLGYSGGGPGLALHDVASVEIMEGPQGTLYGAGAIGGIIRITPNPVALDRSSGSIAGGVTAIRDGATGHDLTGIANLPIVADRIGVRALAYHQREGGYIDDLRRNLSDINGVDTSGGRLALRAETGTGWRLDLGAVVQRIRGDDGQYAETNVGPLARRSTLAQPWTSDIDVGRAVVTRDWDSGLQLVAATGVASSRSEDRFDATGTVPGNVPTLYVNDRRNLLVSHESRLTRALDRGGSWLVGATLIYDRDNQMRTLGTPTDPQDIVGVANVTKSASLFAEATLPFGPALLVTGGARLTTARTDSEPSNGAGRDNFVRGRATTRVDPTLALSWRLASQLAAFGRFQTGFRTGGLAVARGVGRVADFRPDSIIMGEIGLRRERGGATGIAFSTAFSYAHWRDIQADLVSRRGQPYTANIGNADIYGLEGALDWVPLPGLSAEAVLLYTYNRVTGTLAQTSLPVDQRLPQTPAFAANIALSYRWAAGRDSRLRIEGSAHHVGRSILGTSSLLDVSQGDYTLIRLGGGWRWRNFDTALTIDNLTNATGNRFAFGNPFRLPQRTMTTPLQPLSVRLGVGVSW